jgi:hypothetical protein
MASEIIFGGVTVRLGCTPSAIANTNRRRNDGLGSLGASPDVQIGISYRTLKLTETELSD